MIEKDNMDKIKININFINLKKLLNFNGSDEDFEKELSKHLLLKENRNFITMNELIRSLSNDYYEEFKEELLEDYKNWDCNKYKIKDSFDWNVIAFDPGEREDCMKTAQANFTVPILEKQYTSCTCPPTVDGYGLEWCEKCNFVRQNEVYVNNL